MLSKICLLCVMYHTVNPSVANMCQFNERNESMHIDIHGKTCSRPNPQLYNDVDQTCNLSLILDRNTMGGTSPIFDLTHSAQIMRSNLVDEQLCTPVCFLIAQNKKKKWRKVSKKNDQKENENVSVWAQSVR
jgi:hypothetical protein